MTTVSEPVAPVIMTATHVERALNELDDARMLPAGPLLGPGPAEILPTPMGAAPAPLIEITPVGPSPIAQEIIELMETMEMGPARVKWFGLIAPVEVPTGDGRMFAPDRGTNRPLPLPFMAKFTSGNGHSGACIVGRILRIYPGPGGYWASGDFLDPEVVPEVTKAIYLIQQKVIGPSVDLDRTFTVKATDHPTKPGKKVGLFEDYCIIGTTLVPMPAFHQVHLSVDAPETRTLLASAGVDVTDIGFFDVNGESWKSWPIAPREYQFDADDAVKRIAHWAGVGSKEPDLGRYASAFLWRNGSQMGDTMAQDSFRLPLIDIINNEPYLIYHAVYSAAALLSGAHGGLPNIPDEDKAAMVPIVNEIYAAMADAFQDPNLTSPFLEGVRRDQAAITEYDAQEQEEDCGCDEVKTFTVTVEDDETVTTTSSGEVIEFNFGKKKNADEPYGPASEAKYADPGYQDDGKKRYPLNSEARCRAAWSYINMPKNAEKYTDEQLKEIKGRIKAALKKYGVEVDDDESDSGEMSLEDAAHVVDLQSLVAGASSNLLAPPASAFGNPGFKAPTRLQVTEDGRVYGHLARWKVCHVGVGNACVIAPKTKTNYRLFKAGSLVTDDGTQVEVGKITLGTGHANAQWGVMPSREHYDNTGWAAALVNVGEDKHGIWVSGVLTASMTPEKVVELRASPLSGDWRLVNGNLELIAALAVNNPGFPIYREQDGRAFSLMAVGVVEEDEAGSMSTDSETEFAQTSTVDEVEETDEEVEYSNADNDDAELALRQERLADIEADLAGHLQEKRARQFAAIDEERQQLDPNWVKDDTAIQMNAKFVQIPEDDAEEDDEQQE